MLEIFSHYQTGKHPGVWQQTQESNPIAPVGETWVHPAMCLSPCLPVPLGLQLCDVSLEALRSHCSLATYSSGKQLIGWPTSRHSQGPHINSRALSLCCSFLLWSPLKFQTPTLPGIQCLLTSPRGTWGLILQHHLKKASSERRPPCLVPFCQKLQSFPPCGTTSVIVVSQTDDINRYIDRWRDGR